MGGGARVVCPLKEKNVGRGLIVWEGEEEREGRGSSARRVGWTPAHRETQDQDQARAGEEMDGYGSVFCLI